MRIAECVASRGGIFKNREIGFGQGLNVIYGANDSGKTILAQALIDLIFGTFDPSHRIDEDRWNGFFLSAKIEHGGSGITLTRNALSSFSFHSDGTEDSSTFLGDSSKTVRIQEILDTIDTDGLEIVRLISQYPRALFAQTGLLNSPLHGSGPLEYAILRDFFTGAATPFCRNFARIGISDDDTTAFTRAFTGEMISLETQIKSIDKELELYELRSSRTRKLSGEKSEIEKELADINKKESILDEASKIAYGIQYRENEIEILNGEIESRKSEIDAEKTKIGNFERAREKLLDIFPQFSKFTPEQKENLSRIQSIYRQIRSAREVVDRRKAELSRTQRGFIFKSVFTMITGTAAAAGILLYPGAIPFNSRIIPAGIIEGIAVALLALFILLVRRRIKTHPLHDAVRDREELDRKLRDLLAQNQVEVDPLAFDNAYEFLLQYFEEYGFFIDQEDDTREIEQSLKDDDYFRENSSAIADMEKKKAALEEGIRADMDKLVARYPHAESDNYLTYALSMIEKEKTETRAASEKANEMLSRLTQEIESGDIDDPGMKDIAGKRKELENRLLSLYAMERTIRYSRSVFKECTDNREETLLSACA
ncbi:MAG TPA: AAA family ATPase, partial [Spirochaetota bacterium]|nr:AAA family ATPase [Spirochaetota bacterium]